MLICTKQSEKEGSRWPHICHIILLQEFPEVVGFQFMLATPPLRKVIGPVKQKPSKGFQKL